MSETPIWKGKEVTHRIDYSFTCGGVNHFQFKEDFNIPCERAMDGLHVYQEFKNRTDDVFLKAHCAAKQTLYKKNPINIFELKKLDDQLEERLTLALPPPRIIATLASVLYFDETENPYQYDRGYAEEKIKRWRTEKIFIDDKEEGYDFFLSKPINDLLPSTNFSESDFQSYLKITEKIDKIHLQTIFDYLSSNQRNAPTFRTLFSTNIGEKTSG